MQLNLPRPRAVAVFYFLNAAMALLGATMFTTYTVYYVQAAGLNPMQLVLVGTTLETAYLLLEVPTGVVADTYSRRLSVILGVLILGAGFTLVALFPRFETILLGQVITAAGYAFLSGALEAWLADEVGGARAGPILVRSGQFERLAGLAGIGLSVGLTSLRLNLGYLAGGLGYLVLGLVLLLIMPEHGFQPKPHALQAPWAALAGTFRDGARLVRGRPVLLALVAVQFFVGAASEGYDRLGDAHLLTGFALPALGPLKPLAWFGILDVAATLLSLSLIHVCRHWLEAASREPALTARLLLALNALTVAGVLAFALTGNFPLAFVALMVRAVSAALIHPLYTAWLIQHIDSQVRATVLSMAGQTNALGQILGGPGVGLLGSAVSLRAALLVSGLLKLPVLPLYARASQSSAAPENRPEFEPGG